MPKSFGDRFTHPSLSLGRCPPALGDPEQQPDTDEDYHERGATVGDERERDARHGKGVDDAADVDHRLGEDPARDTDGDKASEGVLFPGRDPKAGPAECSEPGDHDEGPDKTEIAGDYGKDEVGVRVRQEPPGRDRSADPAPGRPAEAESRQ